MAAVVATFDSVVTNPGRLKILTALAAGDAREFVHLRRDTGLTDGNLCAHTRRLETAGLVTVEKSFRDRKPVTHVALTSNGRAALEQHAKELLAALGLKATSQLRQSGGDDIVPRPTAFISQPSHADDWVD